MLRSLQIFLNGVLGNIYLNSTFKVVDFLADLLEIVVDIHDLYSWVDPAYISIFLMMLGVFLIAYIICFLMNALRVKS